MKFRAIALKWIEVIGVQTTCNAVIGMSHSEPTEAFQKGGDDARHRITLSRKRLLVF